MMLVMLTVFLGTGQWLDKVSYYDVLAIFFGTVQWLEKNTAQRPVFAPYEKVQLYIITKQIIDIYQKNTTNKKKMTEDATLSHQFFNSFVKIVQ